MTRPSGAITRKFHKVSMIPNIIIDEWMAKLQPVPFKVLVAILRSTIGWTGKHGGRRSIDRISVGRLSDLSGCSKRAVSSALTTLLELNLIRIMLADGSDGSEPSVRQGRILYIGPTFELLEHSLLEGSETNAQVDRNSVHISKEKERNKTTYPSKKEIPSEVMERFANAIHQSGSFDQFLIDREALKPSNGQMVVHVPSNPLAHIEQHIQPIVQDAFQVSSPFIPYRFWQGLYKQLDRT